MSVKLKEVDKVEILTLQDNYVDVAAFDGTEIVQRALPVKDMEMKNSILAEHGFSAIVTITADEMPRSLLFDFGFSEHGATYNADALAFRTSRYIKVTEEFKIGLPALKRERFENAGISLVESEEPRMLLDDSVLFLGEIPKQTEFEKGFPRMHYDEDGETKWDPIEEDSAIVANVKRKGLVILSGCAHSGIINTVKYAREVSGVDSVFVVMGGFHLTGADFEPIIEPTTEALKTVNPQYVVPTHCTGRKAVMHLEKEMPDRFLLNMSGTKMVFAAS